MSTTLAKLYDAYYILVLFAMHETTFVKEVVVIY